MEDNEHPTRRPSKGLRARLWETFLQTWDLGMTSFGGPPVHFHIYRERFVKRHKWIDEKVYQELFAVCQALPGPASTKLGFCITLTHSGILPALLSFVCWSLPGALGMYALAIAVSHIGEDLPRPVDGLLSGLNAATVGIIVVAAVTLGENTVTDELSRLIIIVSACAGLCYTALWYYPMLMIICGVVTVAWDNWGLRKVSQKAWIRLQRITRRRDDLEKRDESSTQDRPHVASGSIPETGITPLIAPTLGETREQYNLSPLVGCLLVGSFFASFITVMVVRGALRHTPVAFKLFRNLFLAGTIIFGGGPVVIPLLRSYIVTEGWVSSRDFLLGLALIQAFPGPNFNFAVFLATLASHSTHTPAPLTAIIGFIGIFAPGMILAAGFSALWYKLRRFRFIVSTLRGVNAAAVGLIWTAVYRLWEVGYLKEGASSGVSLGNDPWWVVTAAVAFSGNKWFKIPPPVSIVMGGLMGLSWSYVVR